jgi:hypothetical protein
MTTLLDAGLASTKLRNATAKIALSSSLPVWE